MLLCAALALLAAAPPASGATISLRDDLRASGVALAGPDVLVMRELRNGTTELIAVPRAGGGARTLLSVPRVQPLFEAQRELSASDTRVALITEILDPRDRTVEWRVYSRPAGADRSSVVRRVAGSARTWVPALVDVDGDRVLIVEYSDEEDDATRAYMLDPAFGLMPVAWANADVTPVAIAGGRAAVYATRPRRMAVVDLATRRGAGRRAVGPAHHAAGRRSRPRRPACSRGRQTGSRWRVPAVPRRRCRAPAICRRRASPARR